MRPGRRSQLVLLAAVTIAVALTPVVFAYLQLGYHEDVTASTDYDAPERSVARVLDRAVHTASDGIARQHTWAERADAVQTVRARLRPKLQTIEASQVTTGTAHQISYNETALTSACPTGSNRRFGPCRTIDGVRVQERAGQTHVLAVAFDVITTTDHGTYRQTVVLRPGRQ
jgi:hypothetical protein